jgi:hypothetical protein
VVRLLFTSLSSLPAQTRARGHFVRLHDAIYVTGNPMTTDGDVAEVLRLERVVGDGFVMARWGSVRGGRRARRTSLWRRDSSGWRLVHHVGTPLPEPAR